MTPEQRQQTLNNVSAEDLEKIKAHKAATKGSMPVDMFWLVAAEFARAFGWEAYMAFKNDEIDLAEMLTMVEANRRLEAARMFENTQAAFVGAVSAQSKKPGNTFKRLTKELIRKTKVDDE